FYRGGMPAEHRTASIRHAQAAIAYGQDDALALSFAGFVIAMDKRDRAAAFTAFDAALAISPSLALAYLQGGGILAFGGDAERAIEWTERDLRLWRSSAFVTLALAHFHRGRFEEAAAAARKAVQSQPGFSMCHLVLAATLATLGQLEEARAAAARVLELQ